MSIKHLRKLVKTFYQNHFSKPIAISKPVNTRLFCFFFAKKTISSIKSNTLLISNNNPIKIYLMEFKKILLQLERLKQNCQQLDIDNTIAIKMVYYCKIKLIF